MFTAFRTVRTRLPGSNLEAGYGEGTGYNCTFHLGRDITLEEVISSERGVLRQQSTFLDRPHPPYPWDPAEARRFLAVNVPKPTLPSFACAAVARLVTEASLASLGTTDAQYAEIMR
jgi:hypothetical protein